jgi:eukaryotic-like serine/threonine-protein kinase
LASPELSRVKEIFEEALARQGIDRAAYLDEACAGDSQLRSEVEAYVRSAERTNALLGVSVDGVPSSAAGPLAETPGTMVGRYKLLERIGEGGFGVVFLAEQQSPVVRKVALKIIKLGMDTRQVIARFEAERQALAMMDHPNIARVLDGGATETGRPYFVMELVAGAPITDYCDKHNLSIDKRLELFAQVCQAVQHAHQKGLIHRDIKPSNILVATADDRPIAKVIDFGIAKATQARLTEKTLFTELRQLIGTPQYMSPEQAEGSLDVDTRSDIYSLGVLLYELLTGTTPFDPRELRSKAYGGIQRIIREVEPPKPSTRLSTMGETIASVAACRHVEPAKLGKAVRGELDWIVMKCLEKDRSRRYDSAASLAGDVLRQLAGEPVLAGPVSTTYRLRKFAVRNKGPVLAAGVMLAILLAGVTGTTIGLIGQARQRAAADQQRTIAEKRRGEAESHRAEARKQAAIADAASRFLADTLASADPDKMLGDKVTVLQVISASVKELDAGKLKDQPLVEASVRNTIGWTLLGLGRSDQAEPNLLKALELSRAFSAEDKFIARCLDHLAVLRQDQGNLPEAERLQREVLDIERKLLPARPYQIASALNNLAFVLRAQHKLSEAETLYREAIDIDRMAGPVEPRNVAKRINNLSDLLHAQGKLAEAEQLGREALKGLRESLPAGHLDIAEGLTNLAWTLNDRRNYIEAEPLWREALGIFRNIHPDWHFEIVLSLHNLAFALHAQGKLAEAKPLYEEALDIARKHLPERHRHTLTILSNLGRLYLEQDKLVDAEPLLREALDGYERVLSATNGAARQDYEWCVQTLVRLYTAWDKAEPGKGYEAKARQWKAKLSTSRPATTRSAG